MVSRDSDNMLFKDYLGPKVCKIMAFRAVIMGLGLLFYILLGFRYIWIRFPIPF